MKWVLLSLILIFAGLISLFFAGSYLFRFIPQRDFPQKQRLAGIETPAQIDQYLSDEEKVVGGIRPGLEKGVVWADATAPRKTPLAFIYLHGFSASRGETAPLLDTVAAEMHANLFYTRLTGHGRVDANGFTTMTAQDWVNDAHEALEIARKIGERVVIVGMSTGANLALQLAAENSEGRNADANDISALILMSPNFRPAAFAATNLTGPFGKYWARLLVGRERGFQPENHEHATLWTPRYPARGLVPLMDLVNSTARLDLAQIKIPTLTIYTKHDTVVDVALIESRFKEIGSSQKEIVDLPEATRHELAGRALAPGVVRPAANVIEAFLNRILR